MTSQNTSTLVSLANINAKVEELLRCVGKIKNSQNVTAFKINFDKMKDGLVPIDYSTINEQEVQTIDLNG